MTSDKRDSDLAVPDELVTVILNHENYIKNKITTRPLVVIGSSTIFWLTNFHPTAKLTAHSSKHKDNLNLDGPYLLAPEQLIQVFDHTNYDVRVFPSGYPGSPFHTTSPTQGRTAEFCPETKSYLKRFGLIHLCLYLPGSPAVLKLVLDQKFTNVGKFRFSVYEFLMAADIVINQPPEHQKERLSSLTHVKLR